MKISLLIPTIPQRESECDSLLDSLRSQIGQGSEDTFAEKGMVFYGFRSGDVEIILAYDDRKVILGEKRNYLRWLASGEYVAYLDDDDKISQDYTQELIKGAQTGVDVVCFPVMRYLNGEIDREMKFSIKFKGYKTKSSHYERPPNHLMLWKKSVADLVPFPRINWYEDIHWTNRMVGKAKTEFQINEVLYEYMFCPAKSFTFRKAKLKHLIGERVNKY